MDYQPNGIIVLFSLPLMAGVVLASITGLGTPDFYIRETPNWQAQSVGQDIMNLFLVVPVLLNSAILAYRNHPTGLVI